MTTQLTPSLIIAAYRRGIFPMGDAQGFCWYSPDPRAVFPLDAFHVPQTLAKTIRQRKFTVKVNQDFSGVMAGCAARDETWITQPILDAYTALYRLGYAHSVEAWRGDELVGGLYGVALGGAFMGESMFSRVSDASKVCLVFLVERLRERGFTLLDSQTPTTHLMRFGQTLIPRDAYMEQLAVALQRNPSFI